MRKIYIFILLLFITVFAFSQGTPEKTIRFSINGYIKDSLTGESVIGASFSVNGLSKGVSSNQYGFYSITLEKGTYSINVSHVSYQSKTILVNLDNDQSYNFEIVPKTSSINEVIVYSKFRDANIKNAQMGKIDLSMNQVRNIPAFMGEVDL